MKYVDGYVVPVPKKRIGEYRALAQRAAKIWREHGMLRDPRLKDMCDPKNLPFDAKRMFWAGLRLL